MLNMTGCTSESGVCRPGTARNSSRRAFHAVVKKIRKQQKLSQADLARILNCSQITVSRYENGESFPSIHRLRRLLSLTHGERQSRVILQMLELAGAIVPGDVTLTAQQAEVFNGKNQRF
jgi:transcriptional regulator with XRE-family HTH domain